jgi:hypothetical protein
MKHFTFACRAALVATLLFGFGPTAQAFQMPSGQRAKITEDSFNGCVNKHLPQYDASWTNKIRTFCACSTENVLNEMTQSEAQQLSRTRVAPPSLQAKADRISEMCSAQLGR